MSKKKIVLLDAKTLGNFNHDIFSKFGEFKSYDTTEPDEVVNKCMEAEIVVTNKVVLNREILQQLKNLKLICITATGTNNIDLNATKELGIIVKNASSYSTKSVAQHTLMFALAFLGKLLYYDNYVKSGEWCKSDIFCDISNPIFDLDSKEWGIIGFGTIGREVARLASAFGARVSYYSTSGKNNDKSFSSKSLNDLLRDSDIISVHAPLNQDTKDLIKLKELELLKENAILLNLGRGGIVNENDLKIMLDSKNFFFGSDVLENEPMLKEHPLLKIANKNKIILTPHVAWAYSNSKSKLLEIVEKNIKDFIS